MNRPWSIIIFGKVIKHRRTTRNEKETGLKSQIPKCFLCIYHLLFFKYQLHIQNEPKIDFKTPPSANSFWNFAHTSPKTQLRRSRRKIMKKLNTWPYSYEEHIPLYLPLTAAVNGKWPVIVLEQKSALIGECASVKLKEPGKPLAIQKKRGLNLETVWIYLYLPLPIFTCTYCVYKMSLK